jgi:hypothetical protein
VAGMRSNTGVRTALNQSSAAANCRRVSFSMGSGSWPSGVSAGVLATTRLVPQAPLRSIRLPGDARPRLPRPGGWPPPPPHFGSKCSSGLQHTLDQGPSRTTPGAHPRPNGKLCQGLTNDGTASRLVGPTPWPTVTTIFPSLGIDLASSKVHSVTTGLLRLRPPANHRATSPRYRRPRFTISPCLRQMGQRAATSRVNTIQALHSAPLSLL